MLQVTNPSRLRARSRSFAHVREPTTPLGGGGRGLAAPSMRGGGNALTGFSTYVSAAVVCGDGLACASVREGRRLLLFATLVAFGNSVGGVWLKLTRWLGSNASAVGVWGL